MKGFLRLGDHCEKIGSGYTPRGGHKSYVSSGIPLIRSQNVLMRSFKREGLVYISQTTHEEMQATEVIPGDVLLNITGASIGRVCVAPEELCPANVNQHVCIIRCKPEFDPNFISLFLSTPEFQKFIMDTQAGGTRQALTKSDIEEFRIPDVGVFEQRKLAASILTNLKLIESAEAASQLQRRELAALANAIVSASCQHCSTRPIALGEVLDEVKDGIGGLWKSFPVLGATREGVAPAKERPGKHADRYKPVRAGTVFYNPMRILIGSIAFVDEDDEPGITSPDYVVLKGKKGVVDTRWFYYWLRSPLGERCIRSLARGAVRERMLFNRLAEGEIELPDYDTQVRASKALAQIKPMRAAVLKQVAELDLLPQKLLAQF
ncbi:MAG: hypothetical protein E5V27_07600 [Mesorhizobium sp.]|nr:MAG: hypothetical protein E5V27_07600 [Mesorhizobium sp.]